ncbi:MAG TPA: ABC transporter permease, partial [Nocardioidaceae bacterium]|nr:ABC transporter permease [Nocardioidaceae bacterium]
VAIAFRAGYWNIGAEGQFLIGAVGVTGVALWQPDLPPAVALPLGFLAGAVGGLLWALLPAWLKKQADIDEVVTTLLLNPVALLVVQGLLNGPWRNTTSGFTDSDRLGVGYDLPPLLPGTRVHWGFGVALLIVAATWFVMARTRAGLQVRACGQAPEAAAFSGIRVRELRWRCALVSGAIAGMGGATQVMGVQHQLTQGISNSYGYTGVIVATLAGLSAIGVLLVSLLFADVAVGAQNVSLVLQVPTQLGAIFAALLLLMVLSAMNLRHYKLVRSGRRAGSGSP